MKQLKKTLLTLVALLAVTTGAWADETPLLTIESKDYKDFTSGSKTFDDKVTVTFSNSVLNDGDMDGWYAAGPLTSLLTVTGTNGYTITSCKFYTKSGLAMNGYTVEGESPSVYLTGMIVYTDASESVNIGGPGVKKIEVYGAVASASTGPEVAWDEAKNTGSFTMPGGNVTLEPDYYPQATVTDGGVTAAAADARATTDDPLVKVDATKLTGAKKLMYFVSNSGTTAPAYDAEGWTDQLPTAESITQQGIVYVWYYPVGTDEGVDGATATYSDGDICLESITARIAAAPTYAVTFNAANANTIEAGKATVTVDGTDKTSDITDGKLQGVKMGSEVKLKANTGYKFRKVEVKKKAAVPTLAETLTTANMTVSVSFLWDGNAETVNFTSNGDGTYTKTGGTGTIATATDWTVQLVENSGKIVFKAYPSSGSENDPTALKFNFFPSDNTYYMWAGKSARSLEPTFTSISVNDTAIAVTEVQDN